jgi:hypothetical protein
MYKIKIFLPLIICLFLSSAFAPKQKLKRFKDKEENISIELPWGWHLKTTDDGNYNQMFVSIEDIKKKGSSYTTGVSITKIRSMSKTFTQVKSDLDIVKLWYGAVKLASQKHYLNEEVNFEKLTLGKYKGVIVETILQPTEHMTLRHMYQAILAHNDDLYTLTMECPAQDWNKYQPLFEAAIVSVELN